MTEAELQALLARNPQVTTDEANPRPRLPNPVPKQDAARALGNTEKEKTTDARRIRVSIVSYRKRLCDADNLAGGAKILLDSLVQKSIIPDDSPEYIDYQIEQYKTGAKPHTVVRIYYP
jgi:hypothetical protein